MKDAPKTGVLKETIKESAFKMARFRVARRVGLGVLGVLICLFLVYAAVGFWVLPSYLKSRAQSMASEKLHRQLVIHKLELNPFTLTLNVEGLRLSEPDSEAHFVSFDRLQVGLSAFSILRMTPVVTELTLVKPFVRVVRFSDGTLNFDDIAGLFREPEGEKPQGEPATQPQTAEARRAERQNRRFGIYNVQIVGAQIELEDREKDTRTVVSELNAGLPYLYRGPVKGIKRHVEPHFEALVNGERFEILREKPSEDSRDRILRFNMDHIDLKSVFHYIPLNPAYRLNDGRLDLHLSLYVHRPKDGETTMDVSGRATMRSVRMTQNGKPFLGLEKLDVVLGTNSLASSAYRIDRLEVVQPEIHAVSNKAGVLNVADLLAHADMATASVEGGQAKEAGGVRPVSAGKTEQAEPKGATLAVMELVVKRGRFHYADQSDALPLDASVSGFDLAVKDAEVDFDARIVKVGEIQSSAGRFDVALQNGAAAVADGKAVKKADTASAFTVQVGKLGISNWNGTLKNDNRGDFAALPVLASISRFGLNGEQIGIDMGKQAISVAQVRSVGGSFDVLMENHPPSVPVTSGKEKTATAPYSIQIGKIDVADWRGKLKNSNRHDPFERPFSAALSGLGVTVDNVEVSMKDRTVAIAGVSTKGGKADVELEPYQKPAYTGKRAQARAALLAAVLEAKKAQPAEGFAVSVGKAAVADWSARVKNQNTTDRAGLPVSGRAEKMDLTLSNVKLDTKKRDINIGEMASKSMILAGQLEKHEKVQAKKANEGVKPVVMPSEDPYSVHIGKLAITGWSAKGRNTNLKNPLGGSVTELAVTGQDLSSVPGSANRLSVRAIVNKTGKLAADGKLGLAPLSVDVALKVQDVNVVAIQPYIEDYVNLTLNRADLSLEGHLLLKEDQDGGYEGGYKGDVAIAQLRTVDQISKDSFIRWNRLALRDVDARLKPFAVHVREGELDRLFARVILNADGRLNLRNVLRSDAGGQRSLTQADSELDDLADSVTDKKSAVTGKGSVTVGKVTPDAGGAGHHPPLVFVEKLILKKGQVRFTDNFIKPHYTANISEMEGTITGLSSNPDAAARLDIRGQVNRAPLTVAGTISPFRESLALDVKAHVRGMELAQFSSYTAKYIGFGIEKGKLSFDVTYKLEDGVLVAQNRLILDQLTFGEKAPGEPVTDLPIELAVSLLKDRNGVIDINLPIGGSLDDPEFSIGGILARVFLGSLKRVILAPFSFLSLKYGGGAELAWLNFDPGSAEIPESEIPKLQALAEAFAERPALRLDITGRYDPAADREGLAKAAIQRKVRALKRKDLQEKGQTAVMSQLTVSEGEYPQLLERVYKDEDFKKPRNFIGMQKTLSVPEMEKQMIDNSEVTEEEFLALANRRSERVKAWLVETGKVADSRIFLLASKAGEAGENGETAARVDFAIE